MSATKSKQTAGQTAAANTKKENTEKENKLTEAKDRAQVTATTAMSVVQVTLLRTLINGGPAANKYYYPVLVLIILSLVLQVTAGLLALVVTHMKSYYQKYREDSCADILDGICCCPLRCGTAGAEQNTSESQVQVEGISNDGFSEIVLTTSAGTETKDKAVGTEAMRRPKSTGGCCSLQFTSGEESKLERLCNQFSSATLSSDLLVEEADVQLQYLTTLQQNTKSARADALANYKEQATEQSKTDHDNAIAKYDEELIKCEKAILKYNEIKRRNTILHEQEDILVENNDEYKKNYVLKKVSFWQQVLNYILYFVFIFNAFITGFGVSPSLDNISNSTQLKS